MNRIFANISNLFTSLFHGEPNMIVDQFWKDIFWTYRRGSIGIWTWAMGRWVKGCVFSYYYNYEKINGLPFDTIT